MTAARAVLIRRGRVVDPSTGFDEIGDVLADAGRVVACTQRPIVPPDAAWVLDAEGLVVTPGFLDLHTHLRFPGFPEKETIESGTAAAAAGGFTTVCAMANTRPVVDAVQTLRLVLDTAAREAVVRLRQLAAVTVDLRGEQLTDMAALAEAGAIAFSDDGRPVRNAEIMRRALEFSAREEKVISVHEEDPDIVGPGVANAGAIADRLGLAAWPCSGEAGMVQRDLALLERAGGRLHIAHVSCAETVDLVRSARARGLPVTAEVTPHHLRLTDRLLDGGPDASLSPRHPCAKVNPPLRSQRDVDALVEALVEGTIDAIATDHAPHTAADKAPPFETAAFGFSGIETALPMLLDLVRERSIALPALIERLTIGPARVFGLEASLRPGSAADVCVFDPDEDWTVTTEGMRSRGKNTPLLGTRLKGRVRWTLVGGAVVYGGLPPAG